MKSARVFLKNIYDEVKDTMDLQLLININRKDVLITEATIGCT